MNPKPVWAAQSQVLAFRFGRHYLSRFRIRTLSLQNPCTELPGDISGTLSQLPALPPGCDAAFLPAHPVSAKLPRLRFGRTLQYVSNSGLRHLIDLHGSFDDYIGKFSRKRRHELRRTVRRFADQGTLDLRLYATSEEILEFRAIAIALSSATYKASFGAAFADLAITPAELAESAARGDARGYVLFLSGHPVAYGFFRAQGANLLFVNTAYDPAHAPSSPGTVMLWLVLEHLFAEQKYAYMDFLWGQYPFKQLFATTTIDVAAVFCFRRTPRNLVLVLAHYALILATRVMLFVTGGARLRGSLRWGSAAASSINSEKASAIAASREP
jgi:CelD/BcsL family acetyltransferase involved in cellulose biosynthesis